MSAGDAQATAPLPNWSADARAPRRRRRMWPWLVAFGVVIALTAVAVVVGEQVARDVVATTVREQVVTRLDLPADQEVAVDVAGPSVLLQLATGSLGEVRIASDDVAFGPLSGDVVVTAQDVPVWGGGDISGATAEVTLDETQVRALLATIDGFPADTVGLGQSDVTVSTELSLFGAPVPIVVTLTPSAADGGIVLTPVSLEVAGAQLSADDIRARFGGIADGVVKDWPVCVAQYLPSAVTVTGAAVEGGRAVLTADIDGALFTDAAAPQQYGIC